MGFVFQRRSIIDTNEFLAAVYGDQTGYVTINSIDDETGALDVQRWISLPNERKFMIRYCELRDSEDVYLSVAVFSQQHRAKEDPLSTARVVWADADTCAPENFRVLPSIIVQTSPGRWHVWWVLDSTVSAARAEAVAQRISVAHAEQGCDRGFTRTKLLRVPGTTNTKHGNDPVTATDTGLRYTIEELEAVYADVSIERVVTNLGDVPEAITGDALLDLEADLDAAGLGDLYTRKPEPGQSWSERLFRFELELFRIGFNPTQVYSVARNAACNKFDPSAAGETTQTGVVIPQRNNPDAVLWADVQKAYAEYLADQASGVDEDTSTSAPGVSFLTIDERSLVNDTGTWIDTYTDWALTRSPQSAPDYHRSLAYLVLSAAFSDRVCIPLKYGVTYPNLWTLIIGDSTRSRKSTAMNFALAIIHRLEDIDGEKLDIGNDATQEALIQELGKRDGQFSLLHTDEVSGFFQELYLKNYRVGTIEKFTEIYGGSVPVALRSSKDAGNKVRARTAFGFLGVGVRKHVAESLTRRNFESGFLLRMTWTVADSPRYQKGDSDVEFGEKHADGTYDSDFRDMAVHLWEVRERYSQANPTSLGIEQDALDRLNQFAHDAHVLASKETDDTLDAGVDRLRDSVLKAAALLAAYYREPKINLFHVLAAIAQGEIWFRGLVRMLSEVSNSSFGRQQDDVFNFILVQKGHEVPESQIYRKFRFKPSEFNEIMTGLRHTGLVKRVDSNRWKALV